VRVKEIVMIPRIRGIFTFFLLIILTAGSPFGHAAPSDDLQIFDKLQNIIISVSEKIKPCVVHIEAYLRTQQKRVRVTGSGILVNREGYILTNSHVVYQAEKVVVTIPGTKKQYEPLIVGTDQMTDLAVLRIPPSGDLDIPFPAFGDSSKLKVGEWVIAVGNPYGLDGTVSFGIVSAKGRNLNVGLLLSDFIQTDAMIDPGSSGGPLVNLSGEIIGINTMAQGRGIGFTIPIETALNIMQGFIDQGGIERGWLGVKLQPLSRKLAAHLKIPEVSGVIVTVVNEDSPAETAGILPGDIITAFDHHPVEAETDEDLKVFARGIAQTEIGKEVEIRVLRGNQPMVLQTTITQQPEMSSDEIETLFGFNVTEITTPLYFANRLFTMNGMFVSFVDTGSPAGEADLEPGDVIVKIEGMPVSNKKEFEAALTRISGYPRFLIQFYRGRELRVGLLETRSEGREADVPQ
jgi:serine protease Do